MKKLCFYIFIVFPNILFAQNLSIEDLWNSLSNTNSAKQKQLALRIANQDAAIERVNRYPVVFADANITRNLIIPTTPVPAIAFDPNADGGVYLPLKFATRWNSKVGLQAEWNVFDPTHRNNEKAKQILINKAELEAQENLQNLKQNATLAYASIVLSSLQYKAALEDSIRYHEILNTVTRRHQAGRETNAELILAQQELERKKIQIYESWAVLKEANLELQKYIELDNVGQLSSSIEDISSKLSSYKKENFNAEIQQLEIDLDLNERQMLKKQLLPTLTMNAFYGSQFFNQNLNLANLNNWYGNSFVNLALRLPVSAFLVQHKAVDRNRTQIEESTLKLAELIKHNEINNAQQNAKVNAAILKIKSLKSIVLLSLQNINQQKSEFDAGRVLRSEYVRNLSVHNSSLKELWQAEYDLIFLITN